MRHIDSHCDVSVIGRREFLIGSAAAASLVKAAQAPDAATRAKLDRISVMSNGFGSIMPEIWDRSKEVPPKQLDMMDLPDALADRLHLHNLEVCNINLLSMEPSYIKRFKERLDKAKSKAVNLVVEIDPPETSYRGRISVCSPDPAIRAQALETTKQWIDIAAVLGAPSIMPNQGVAYLTEDLAPAIEGLKALADYGKTKNVLVILEPRRMPLEKVVSLIKATGIYANPHAGPEPQLRALLPFAPTVQHVSSRSDIVTAVRISKEMGFKGWYSLEAGGADPWSSMQKVIDALLANL